MPKVNLYYKAVLRRENVIKKAILNFFLSVASYPRLLLEVFLRKNFGCRYFSFASAITIAVLLFAISVFYYQIFPHPPGTFENYEQYQAYLSNRDSFFKTDFITWYLFLIAFVFVSYKRQKEIERQPSVFDFALFSLYDGDIDPRFQRLRQFGLRPTVRNIMTIYEPAIFFIAGILLHLIGQKLGVLFMVSSVFYSFGYVAAFKIGDDFILDKIDEMIMNEEMEDSFVNNKDASETRGVRFLMEKPTSIDMRRKLADAIVVEQNEEMTLAF